MIHKVTIVSQSADPRGSDPSPVGVALRELPTLAERCVRLRIEGRSTAPGPKPGWLQNAGSLWLKSYSNGGQEAALSWEVPLLGEAAPEVFAQTEIWPTKPAPTDTSLDLIGDVFTDLSVGGEDSERLDPSILQSVARLGGALGDGITELRIGGQRYAEARAAKLSSELVERATALRGATPEDTPCRVVGKLDMIRASTQGFALTLDDGAEVTGVYVAETDLVGHRDLVGERVVVQGRLVHRSSGSPLRIEAEELRAAAATDTAFWSTLPRGARQEPSPADLRVRQGPRSGLAAIIGKWPGDESDEEIERALAALDQ